MTEDTLGPIDGLLRDESTIDLEQEGSDILSDTNIPERSIKDLLIDSEDLPERGDVLAPPPVRKKRSLGIG
jgi:hypothetical protein